MILRINIPIPTEIDSNYEVKLVDKAVITYLEKLPYHGTKSKKKTVVVPRTSETVNSQDLFLPVHSSSLPETNPLLADDDHLFLILSESEDEDHEIDEEMEESEPVDTTDDNNDEY